MRRTQKIYGLIIIAVLLMSAVTQISLTTQVKGILPGANGGTGNGFTAFSGPGTSLKTFTLPNASATVLTDNAAVTVAQGGTGQTSLTANNILIGNATSAISFLAPSSSGKIVLSNGTTFVMSTPTFPNASATSGKVIISDGTNWIASTPTFPSAAGSSGNVLTSDGTNWTSAAPSGGAGGGNISQVFIQTADKTVDNTGTETTLIGTGTGSVTLATGDINTAAKSVWFRMEGIFSTTASGDDVVFRVKYGTTTLGSVTVTGTNLGTSQTDLGWSIEGVITTRTTGATGTVMCTAKVTWDATKAVTGSGSNFIFGTATLGGGTATTVDLTSSKAFDITCDWTNAASGRKFTSKNFILEKM